jgi:hypothetical protein
MSPATSLDPAQPSWSRRIPFRRNLEAIPAGKRVTLGGDKNYDTQEFVRELRGMNISPHVAQNTTKRRSAVDNYEVLVVEDSD